MTPHTAQGAAQASQPCHARNQAQKTLAALEADFLALRRAWSETQPDDPYDHGAKIHALLRQVQQRPIQGPSDAATKMRMAMERSCWKALDAESVAVGILHQVAGYLEGLEDAE